MEACIERRSGGVRIISVDEIKEMARSSGVPESTVERDYAQSWLLVFLSSNLKMALKGGTGIRKVFLEDYRFSDDMDFTLLEEYDKNDIEKRVKNAVKAAKEESGINFEEDVTIKEVKNGYEISVYFRIVRTTGSPLRIKLDLTRKDNEINLLPYERRILIHPFLDVLETRVLSYSFEEVFAEKIRALFERTRSRDLYDVWRLSKLGLEVSAIIKDKFVFKGVIFDLDKLLDRRDDFNGSWEASLSHQLSVLPDFDEVFVDVVKYLEPFSEGILC